MRDKLNSNPLLQLAVVGVLLVGTGFFVLSSSGGGGEGETGDESGLSSTTVTTADGSTSVTATVEAGLPSAVPKDVSRPPWSTLPADLRVAVRSPDPVVILLVRGGNELEDYTNRASARIACCVNPNSEDFRIDNQLLDAGLRRLDVQLFVAGAQQMSRFAAITLPLGIDRVPALIVLKPGSQTTHGLVQAIVEYGYLTYENIAQAVIDAGYEGRTLDYHP